MTVRFRDFITTRWRSTCLRWRLSFNDVPQDQRWDYCQPFLRRYIGQYRPLIPLSCDLHLIGRPEYLAEYQEAARAMFTGRIQTHVLPANLTHQETVDPECSQAWIEVIKSCLKHRLDATILENHRVETGGDPVVLNGMPR